MESRDRAGGGGAFSFSGGDGVNKVASAVAVLQTGQLSSRKDFVE